MRELAWGGTTVLLTTQYMEEAEALARHVAVMDHGRIIASGSPEELKRQVAGRWLRVRPEAYCTMVPALIMKAQSLA